MASQQPGGGFNEDDPQYKCCCQNCHSKGITIVCCFFGGAIFALVVLIGGTAVIAGMIDQAKEGGHKGEIDKGAAAGVLIAVVVVGVLALIIYGGVQIWFFTIVLACYRYLRDKARYAIPATYMAGSQPGVVFSGPPSQGYGYPQAPAYGAYPPQQQDAPPTYPQKE